MNEDETVAVTSTEEAQQTDFTDENGIEWDAAGDAGDLAPADEPVEDDRPARFSQALSPAARQIVAWFSACGRCSFFLPGYRLTCDEAAWETAVARRKKHWLVLPWSRAAAILVDQTYGSQIDVDCFHYDGQCPECRRRFTLRIDEDKPETTAFRIELKPS